MSLDTYTVILVEYLLYVTRSAVRREIDTNLREISATPIYLNSNKGPRRFIYPHLHTIVTLRTVTGHPSRSFCVRLAGLHPRADRVCR